MPLEDSNVLHILGGGAVGQALAVFLQLAGRRVCLVRTGGEGAALSRQAARLQVTDGSQNHVEAEVECVGLQQLGRLTGPVAVAVKSHANATVAAALARCRCSGPVILLQNGLGVERPFLEQLPGASICRAVLYMSGERRSASSVVFRSIASCPVGAVSGSAAEGAVCANHLSTSAFPFHSVEDISPHVWSKTLLNAVFNSICPLVEADNGLFSRDPSALALASQVLQECLALAARYGVRLQENDLLDRLLAISRGSDGVLISTLQDLRLGRTTEMEALNGELARLAQALEPPQALSLTAALGRLVILKADAARNLASGGAGET